MFSDQYSCLLFIKLILYVVKFVNATYIKLLTLKI